MFIFLIFLMVYIPYIPINLFNIDISSLSKNMIILYNLACDLVFMLIIFLIYKKDIIHDFKNYFKIFQKIFKLSFKYYFIGLVIMVTSNILISFLFSSANANNEEIIREYINLYPLYMILSTTLYTPFTEEIIFRKAIRNCFLPYKDNKLTEYLYIITSSLIFASIHVIGLGENIIDYIYIIPYLSLSIAFAFSYYKSNNIFSTITIHCIHNTIALILYFMVGVVK